MMTDVEKNQLKGRVKQIQQESFNAIVSDGSITLGDRINDFHRRSYSQEFNMRGFLTKTNLGEGYVLIEYNYIDNILSDEMIYNLSGVFLMKHSHTYDSNGNKTEFTKYYANGKVFSSLLYKYDVNGSMIEGYTEENMDSNTKYFFKYDSENNLSEAYNIFNQLIDKYDNSGNIVEHYEYHNSDSFSVKSVRKYNEYNKIVESISYNNKAHQIGDTIKYVYDEHKNVTETCDYKASGEICSKITFKYDYDGNGNWTTKIESRNYSFGYDETGVWVESKLANQVPVYIVTRNITYWV